MSSLMYSMKLTYHAWDIAKYETGVAIASGRDRYRLENLLTGVLFFTDDKDTYHMCTDYSSAPKYKWDTTFEGLLILLGYELIDYLTERYKYYQIKLCNPVHRGNSGTTRRHWESLCGDIKHVIKILDTYKDKVYTEEHRQAVVNLYNCKLGYE